MGFIHFFILVVTQCTFQKKNYLKALKTACAVLFSSALFTTSFFSTTATAQSSLDVPPQTESIVSALGNVEWQVMEEGLDSLFVSTALGVRLHAFKISPKKFSLSLSQQSKVEGELVQEFAQRLGAVIAVNGGFFAKQSDGSLRSVGLLIDDGTYYSRAWKKTGGYLILGTDGASVLPTSEPLRGTLIDAIQSKPVIMETGGKWALNRNLKHVKNRTLVCVQKDKTIILLTFSGLGLSLFEAGWTLRNQEWGGWFDCDSAIALDGGGSTQLYVENHPDFSVHGDTAVQNALIVKRK